VSGLAFLVLCTLLATSLVAAQDGGVLAFLSPSSPLGSTRATLAVVSPSRMPSPLSIRVERTMQGTEEDPTGPAWRFPLGIGVIVLGLGLVIGGLFYLLRQ
jgi:hypothetical protein